MEYVRKSNKSSFMSATAQIKSCENCYFESQERELLYIRILNELLIQELSGPKPIIVWWTFHCNVRKSVLNVSSIISL